MSNIVNSITNINFLSQTQFDAITAPSNNELYAVEFTPKGFNLFDYKLSNYTLNDPRWLSANAFTWQYCDYVDENYQGYSIAYNHLITDYNQYWESRDTAIASNWQSEVIKGTTVVFITAADGHKICYKDQEAALQTIYDATGAADYFLLDPDNKRFKLPRKQKRQLIQSWSSGSSWYKLYSDGWVEQGGGATTSAEKYVTVTLPKSMKDTSYTVSITAGWSNAASGQNEGFQNRTTTSINITTSYASTYCMWEVHGYAASVPTQTQLEYYYVGEYTIPALENTAGINTETLNNKADISDVSHLAFPSNRYISLPTTDASGTTYTAPADGWYTYRGGGTGSTVGQYVVLESSSGLSMNCLVTTAGNTVRAYLPVSKGQTCTWRYTTTAHAMWQFVYANGVA